MQINWRQKMSVTWVGITLLVLGGSAGAYPNAELEFRKPLLGDAAKSIKDVHFNFIKDPESNQQILLTKDSLKSRFGLDEVLLTQRLGENVKWEILADDLSFEDLSLKSRPGQKVSFLFVLPKSPFATKTAGQDKDKKKGFSFSLKRAGSEFLKMSKEVLAADFLLKLINIDLGDESSAFSGWGNKPLHFPISSRVKTIGQLKKSIAGGVIAVIKYVEKVPGKEMRDPKEQKSPDPSHSKERQKFSMRWSG